METLIRFDNPIKYFDYLVRMHFPVSFTSLRRVYACVEPTDSQLAYSEQIF